MRQFITTIALTLTAATGFAQSIQTQQKIMVIPFTKDGEDIRTVLDSDVNRRIAIAKVKEGLDAKGFTTVDFVGKLKAARDNQVFTSDNQTDIKSKIIEFAACDIFIVAEVDAQQDNQGSGVNVILTSYESATGNSLASKVGSSGKFFTADLGKLTNKAAEKCMEGFAEAMLLKLADIAKNGQSVLVNFSFAENAATNMAAKVNNEVLSDALELWMSEHTVNGNYHIQGTTSLKMIFDDARIPLKDPNNNRFTASKFSLQLISYLKSLGLSASRDVKGNTIYITIN